MIPDRWGQTFAYINCGRSAFLNPPPVGSKQIRQKEKKEDIRYLCARLIICIQWNLMILSSWVSDLWLTLVLQQNVATLPRWHAFPRQRTYPAQVPWYTRALHLSPSWILYSSYFAPFYCRRHQSTRRRLGLLFPYFFSLLLHLFYFNSDRTGVEFTSTSQAQR